MMGLIFLGDRRALLASDGRNFDLRAIKQLLDAHGIALNDTGRTVRRLRGNASDKFLEIVEPVPLDKLLAEMPECRAMASTGEKAAQVIASLTNTAVPKMGQMVTSGSGLEIWRMPSTSRAYPLALEKKAEFYSDMFNHLNII